MAITLVFENGDTGQMACAPPTPLRCFACGGRPPYAWTVTKGTVSPATGVEVTLTPPATCGDMNNAVVTVSDAEANSAARTVTTT